MEEARYLTILEACRLAKVSRRTIYNWLKAGKLRTKRTVGGSVRIDPASLFISTGQGTVSLFDRLVD